MSITSDVPADATTATACHDLSRTRTREPSLSASRALFTERCRSIDNTLNDSMRMALATLASITGSVILIAIVSQYFLIAMAGIVFIIWQLARFYRVSARDIKRLDNLLRSALYAHFSESLSGLATIRAYGVKDKFLRQSSYLVDLENRAYLLTVINQRWLSVRLDLFGALLTFIVAIISVAGAKSISPSKIGLILTYILTISQSLSWCVRQTAEVGLVFQCNQDMRLIGTSH